ncbi:MAG: hypothetical protein BRD40_00560, partial [Bacteroidetes bacterium QS_1_65_9]
MNLVSGFIELLLAANFPWQSAQAPIENLKERAAPDYLAYRGVALGYRDTERYEQALRRLLGMLRRLRNGNLALSEQVEAVIDYYAPILEDKHAEDHPKRQRDLEHFAEVAENYQRRTRFLEDLALDPIELSARENEAPESDEPPLVLSTIHSAKGLEFHTVFIIQAVEGNLPSRHAFGTPAALDEELRLLYVAATRAKEELFISYPSVRYRRGRG